MKPHPYLRAYMAGIAVPTPMLLVAMSAFVLARFGFDVPVPIERAIVFPMAIVPNAWGAWNMLRVGSETLHRWPIGLYGATLPLLLVPLGFPLVHYLVTDRLTPGLAATFTLFAIALYYLAWKHLVAYCNAALGIE
jgi:hypothetical protein